jgi:uncharacterized protein (TIGR01244 family)
MFRTIDERISVSPQIGVEDVAAAAAAGFTTIVNNRPDGEVPDQTPGAAIEQAAAAAGLDYHFLPVGQGFQLETVSRMRDVLADPRRRVLAYCRSGTRSTNLWALAAAMSGEDSQSVIERAAAAGYDVSALAPLLAQLQAQGRGQS